MMDDADLITDGAIRTDVMRARQAHDTGWVLECAIGISVLEEALLKGSPLFWCDGVCEYPVAVNGFATCVHLHGGFRQV